MSSSFRALDPEKLEGNVFKLIGSDWMLVTAGSLQKYNMMTASWGGLGILWGKPVCFCVVRPHRYTYEFMERENAFTLSFFEKDYKKVLNLCGSKSGRDIDKTSIEGLTPAEGGAGSIYFNEAKLVLECKKLYYQDINPENFVDPSLDKNYPDKDYHRMYVGEIVNCLIK